MKTILIIGSSGFLGRRIVKKLKRKPYKIIGFSRNKDKFIKNHICGNILSYKEIWGALRNGDIVIHLVASDSTNSRIKRRTIIGGTRNIIKAAKKFKIKKIIFLSSYAASKKIKDTTAIAKLDAEKIIKESGIRYTILRPTLIYGKGGRVFNHIIKTTNYPIVPIIGDGQNKVAPVYVDDVAELAIKVIGKKYDNKIYTVIGDLTTYNDFIKNIIQMKNEQKILLHVPIKLLVLLNQILYKTGIIKFDKKRILRAVEDVKRDEFDFRKEINYKLISLEDGLKESFSNQLIVFNEKSQQSNIS